MSQKRGRKAQTALTRIPDIPPTLLSGTDSPSKKGNKGGIPEVVLNTYTMVNDPSTDEYVKWTESGNGFVVLQEYPFTEKVLPNYFRTTNFSSFVRQLNFYGFKKRTVNQQSTFQHPDFKRGDKASLKFIVRKTSTKGGGGGSSSSSSRHAGGSSASDIRSALSQLTAQVQTLQHQYHQVYSQQEQIMFILMRFMRLQQRGRGIRASSTPGNAGLLLSPRTASAPAPSVGGAGGESGSWGNMGFEELGGIDGLPPLQRLQSQFATGSNVELGKMSPSEEEEVWKELGTVQEMISKLPQNPGHPLFQNPEPVHDGPMLEEVLDDEDTAGIDAEPPSKRSKPNSVSNPIDSNVASSLPPPPPNSPPLLVDGPASSAPLPLPPLPPMIDTGLRANASGQLSASSPTFLINPEPLTYSNSAAEWTGADASIAGSETYDGLLLSPPPGSNN